MKLVDGSLDLSASDVSAAFSCRHRTALDLAVARKERPRPTWFDPMAGALQERGLEHERRYVDSLRAQGRELLELGGHGGDSAVIATADAMKTGADVIVQASLRQGVWNGRADVLLRVDAPSKLGPWGYEAVDTKLSQETKAASVLQVALYSELLSHHLGALPERFWIITPGDMPSSLVANRYRCDDFHAYFRFVRSVLKRATSLLSATLLAESYPEPVDHCDVCRFWQDCDARRRADDHLSFVAGISSLQRCELTDAGLGTLATLAKAPLPLPFKPKRGSLDSLVRVREQARVQYQGRLEQRPIHELLPLTDDQGLAALPLPSAGDVFLDIEGDRFAENGGREYLIGLAYHDANAKVRYESHWAPSPGRERVAFETVIDFLTARWAEHPGMHVYHYAHYEPTAFKRLMGRHASREEEVDRLLRAGRFVDLYRVVRNAVRASVERYSIKDLEVFYGFQREVELRKASAMLRVVEHAIEISALEMLEPEALRTVEGYNRDDCVSALELRDWLERLRSDSERNGAVIPRPPQSDGAPSEGVEQASSETQALADRLLKGIPDEPSERTPEQRARWLVAHMLEFHRREEKPVWWEYHRLRAATDDELLSEKAGLSGLSFVRRKQEKKKRSEETVDYYHFPEQDYDVREGDALKASGQGDSFGAVVSLDRGARLIGIKKPKAALDLHPSAAFSHDVVPAKPIPEALMELGKHLADPERDASSVQVEEDILLRRPPRLSQGEFQKLSGETLLAFSQRVCLHLSDSVLTIQGPPGSGKTHTAARLICALLKAGKTVGITGPNHNVIRGLLIRAIKDGEANGIAVRAIVKVKSKREGPLGYEEVTDNKRVWKALAEREANVVAGTSWLWANQNSRKMVDVLFVDEAGQLSLANTLAAAQGARNVVLLGDPQQLEQPLKGSHPDGVAVSALQHVLGQAKTIADENGIFLAETWRLPPKVCAFTSELFYDSRLQSREGLEQQQLTGTDGLDGAGIWYAPCSHRGNQSASPEEVSLGAVPSFPAIAEHRQAG